MGIINRLSEFKPTIVSLNNPSLISSLIPPFDLESLCKWTALLLLAYAFTSFSNRLKLLILHFTRKSKSLLPDPLVLDGFTTGQEENDDVCSSSDDEEDEQPTPSSSYGDLTRFDDDFRVKGGFRRRRSFVCDNFSLSELATGNGVVGLWESAIPSVLLSPPVIFTANAGEERRFRLGLWDLRMKMESPAVQAEWCSDRRGRAVGIDAGRTGKIYMSDEMSMGLAVDDVRKIDTPLEYLTEFGGQLTMLYTREVELRGPGQLTRQS